MPRSLSVCLLLQDCRTYYKAVRGGGTREEPGTLTQGAPIFPEVLHLFRAEQATLSSLLL
jgi:hypothetical protein